MNKLQRRRGGETTAFEHVRIWYLLIAVFTAEITYQEIIHTPYCFNV